ncbi:MAG: hypothetical protein LBG69_05190 [Zoogloeaceae bacterium]|nr:hypothetical protein [Zoogloeaceae bacterium]
MASAPPVSIAALQRFHCSAVISCGIISPADWFVEFSVNLIAKLAI